MSHSNPKSKFHQFPTKHEKAVKTSRLDWFLQWFNIQAVWPNLSDLWLILFMMELVNFIRVLFFPSANICKWKQPVDPHLPPKTPTCDPVSAIIRCSWAEEKKSLQHHFSACAALFILRKTFRKTSLEIKGASIFDFCHEMTSFSPQMLFSPPASQVLLCNMQQLKCEKWKWLQKNPMACPWLILSYATCSGTFLGWVEYSYMSSDVQLATSPLTFPQLFEVLLMQKEQKKA